MNRQRSYRPDRSPIREPSPPSYPQSQVVRSELSMLQQENAILKLKCKKVSELQQKVQMVLRQNSQLLSQNEKMSRILHQQKTQNQVLKNKVQSLSVQRMGYVNEFEVQRKKLLIELEKVGEDLAEMELLKNNQINEIKNNYQVEIQALKRQLHNADVSTEAQIRKYRDQLDKREHQLADYVNKLKRITTQTDYEVLKIKEEKEKLKAQITYLEADRINELENLKTKLENNYFQEIQTLKRTHLAALEEAVRENTRLKDSIDDKLREIEQINSKSNKQRVCLEDNINYLKRDNQALRNKIIQTEKMGHYQIGDLKERLNNLHESQIEELISKHQSQTHMLEGEITRLENIIHGKNVEIEQLIKEKVTTRNIFDSELGRLKQENIALSQRSKQLEVKINQNNNQSLTRINDREKHIQYLQEVLKDQKSSADSELAALQKTIDALRQDINTEKIICRQKQQAHKEEVADLKHQIAQLNLNAEQKQAQLNKNINQLKNQLNGTSEHLNTKADSLNSKNRILQKQNEAIKNNLALKQKQIRTLSERLKVSGERESRLQAEIDQLRNKLIKNQQKSNELVNDQKNRLQLTYANALDSLKSDHEAALRLQAHKYRDLQEKLRKKQIELQELLRKYKKMTQEIQVLTQQEANKKDITLKYPGATADLIATKNLFDVYLKTKVLDVCGDALKQNSKAT